jgi:hypothetical protein
MKKLLAAVAFLATVPAFAQALTSTSAGIVIAHDGVVEIPHKWRVEGVRNATGIVASAERVAVLDALRNEAVVVDLVSGRATRIATAETPIAAVFVGSELSILCRDARLLQRGAARIAVAADPAFLRSANGKLYVYSRTSGALEEITGARVSRRMAAAPFASDLEISGNTAYLVYPRDGRIRTIDLTRMQSSGEIAVGGVPVDLAFAGGGTALTARLLAVADPSAKRVWLEEGTQSMTEAVTRGVLRGFLGLGLFGSRASEFPTGVDRVSVRGSLWIAYDSSSGTLYRFNKRSSSVVARNVPPHGFALTADGVAWWDGTSVAQRSLR